MTAAALEPTLVPQAMQETVQCLQEMGTGDSAKEISTPLHGPEKDLRTDMRA